MEGFNFCIKGLRMSHITAYKLLVLFCTVSNLNILLFCILRLTPYPTATVACVMDGEMDMHAHT